MLRSRLPLIVLALVLVAGITYVWSGAEPQHAAQTALPPEKPLPPPPEPDAYGLVTTALDVDEGTVHRNMTLARLLEGYGVPYGTVTEMAEASRPVFDVRRIRPGHPFRVYRRADSTAALRYFVYEESPTDYVVFDVADSVHVYRGEREVERVRRVAEGRIDGSLYQTLMNADASPELAFKLAEMYAWQIDFYRIRKGDAFKVVYEEERLDGEPVGVGDIVAARFTHRDEPYYGFRFVQDGQPDYFDERGESLRKAFLKAPLRYSRISSRYTKRRFHPILKRNRPHLGTDYAAPRGTPVHTVGDGVVVEARYTRGNGRYVKVRHNATYTTQYLHFSRIAEGIKPGVRVRQGDVIGYVGSTGLATGPHLCFRFWKDGKQVDPFKQQIPSANPVDDDHRADYERVRDRLLPLVEAAEPGDLLAMR